MPEELFTQASESLVKSMGDTISKVDPKKVEKARDLILSAKRIFVYGVGRSGLVGKAFAMRLVQMGLESYFIGETITPIVQDGDVAVVVSNTGATMSAIQTANIVRRVGGKAVTVTSRPSSKLAHAANVLIHIPVTNHGPDPLAPLGTKFEDATLLVFDSLIAMLMKAKGETEETLRNRHAILV